MKYTLKLTQMILLLTTSAYAGTLMAHVGEHHTLTHLQQLAHFLSHPYHLLGLLGMAAVIAGIMVWHYRQRG